MVTKETAQFLFRDIKHVSPLTAQLTIAWCFSFLGTTHHKFRVAAFDFVSSHNIDKWHTNAR
jgi:hypothetical protein